MPPLPVKDLENEPFPPQPGITIPEPTTDDLMDKVPCGSNMVKSKGWDGEVCSIVSS
jgi:hypothetical protein